MQNIFIIEIHEEYDCYDIERCYPFITSMTQLQVMKWLEDLKDVALDYKLKSKRNPFFQEPQLTIGEYKINYLTLTEHDLPRVMTLRDWLLRDNLNNGERPDDSVNNIQQK